MFGLGILEIVIVLIIVIVLFGASKLPEIGRGAGEALKNFKKSISETPERDDVPKKNGNINMRDLKWKISNAFSL